MYKKSTQIPSRKPTVR